MRMGEGSGVVGLDESASKAATEEEEEEEEEATFFSRSEKEGGRAPPFSGACFWRGLQNEEIEKLFEGDIFKNARETFLSCDEASMTHLHQLNEHNFYFFFIFLRFTVPSSGQKMTPPVFPPTKYAKFNILTISRHSIISNKTLFLQGGREGFRIFSICFFAR